MKLFRVLRRTNAEKAYTLLKKAAKISPIAIHVIDSVKGSILYDIQGFTIEANHQIVILHDKEGWDYRMEFLPDVKLNKSS